MQKRIELCDLTPDALFQCLRHLDASSLCRLSAVSLSFWRKASSNELWKPCTYRDYQGRDTRLLIEPTTQHWKLEVSFDSGCCHDGAVQYKFLFLRAVYLSKYQQYLVYGWPLKAPTRAPLSKLGSNFFCEEDVSDRPEAGPEVIEAAEERRFAGSQGNRPLVKHMWIPNTTPATVVV